MCRTTNTNKLHIAYRVGAIIDALRHALLVADRARVERLHCAVLVQVATLDLQQGLGFSNMAYGASKCLHVIVSYRNLHLICSQDDSWLSELEACPRLKNQKSTLREKKYNIRRAQQGLMSEAANDTAV